MSRLTDVGATTVEAPPVASWGGATRAAVMTLRAAVDDATNLATMSTACDTIDAQLVTWAALSEPQTDKVVGAANALGFLVSVCYNRGYLTSHESYQPYPTSLAEMRRKLAAVKAALVEP